MYLLSIATVTCNCVTTFAVICTIGDFVPLMYGLSFAGPVRCPSCSIISTSPSSKARYLSGTPLGSFIRDFRKFFIFQGPEGGRTVLDPKIGQLDLDFILHKMHHKCLKLMSFDTNNLGIREPYSAVCA